MSESFLTKTGSDLRVLWWFFKPYKAQMAVVVFFMILSGFLESLNLAALYPIINYGLNLENTKMSLKFLDSLAVFFGRGNLFVSSCLLLIAITVIAAVFKILDGFLASRLTRKIIAENQKAIFGKYVKTDYGFFVQNQQGKLIYAGTVAPVGVASNVIYATKILNNAITALFFVGLLIALSWQGTVLISALGLFYILFVKGITQKVINRSSHLMVEEDRKKNVILNEFIGGIKTIKTFLSEEYWEDKYSSAVEKSAFYNFKVMVGRILPDCFLKVIFFTVFAFVGISFGLKGQGSILPVLPVLGTFATVASRLFPYLNMIGGDAMSVVRYMPDVKIVFRVLNESTHDLKEGARILPEFKSKISFSGVWFKYEEMEDFLLQGVNFDIERNKTTALVGPSGSGKTTIVNLILRLYDAQKGEIAADGVDIREFTLGSYLSKIGYVSQETFIFNGTIRENIQFGLDAPQEAVAAAARLANAHEFILAAEKGYETAVGDAGMKLSGGQRQRIAIARAMLRKPQIIVLDEATSSLDNISEKAVQQAIQNISQHSTVVIIAHRLSTIQHADKIILIDKGRIVQQGIHRDLLVASPLYRAIYDTVAMDRGE